MADTIKLDPNEQLIEEASQALVNNEETALQTAMLGIVGKFLEYQMRQADALERIAETLNSSVHRADSGFFVKVS